jgi:hypothetical protein
VVSPGSTTRPRRRDKSPGIYHRVGEGIIRGAGSAAKWREYPMPQLIKSEAAQALLSNKARSVSDSIGHPKRLSRTSRIKRPPALAKRTGGQIAFVNLSPSNQEQFTLHSIFISYDNLSVAFLCFAQVLAAIALRKTSATPDAWVKSTSF